MIFAPIDEKEFKESPGHPAAGDEEVTTSKRKRTLG